MNNIERNQFNNILIPLPPLAEQRAIVLHVVRILAMTDEIESQVKERRGQVEEVLQVVLREAFQK
jgi:type I restriction enzyme S subunit